MTVGKINTRDYGNPPALAVADLPAGSDTAVLTVQSVEEYVNRQRGGGKQLGIHFVQFPDKAWYLNITILRGIIAKLGDNAAAWVGKRIPVEVISVKNPESGEQVQKLYPVNPGEWDKLVEKAEREESRRAGRAR